MTSYPIDQTACPTIWGRFQDFQSNSNFTSTSKNDLLRINRVTGNELICSCNNWFKEFKDNFKDNEKIKELKLGHMNKIKKNSDKSLKI